VEANVDGNPTCADIDIRHRHTHHPEMKNENATAIVFYLVAFAIQIGILAYLLWRG
jgi:hypothetical protein